MFSVEGLAQGTGAMEPHSLTWILVLGLGFAFLDAFGIGANDVANSFATSVGSRVLTLGKAVTIALFTEFLGAVMLGANVTSTIRNGIIDVELFNNRPDMLMYGMMCAMIGSSTFVLLATRLGMPVSTTHAIVGAIMGMGIVSFGPSAVDWSWNGAGKIFASFVISPVLSGIIAAAFFMFTKYTVLIHENSFQRALYLTPVYAAVTMVSVMAFWVYKGTPALALDKKPLWVQMTIIFVPTVLVSLASALFIVPYMKKKAMREEIEGSTIAAARGSLEAAEAAAPDYMKEAGSLVVVNAAKDTTTTKATQDSLAELRIADDADADAATTTTKASTGSEGDHKHEHEQPAVCPAFKDDAKGWTMYWLNRTVLRGIRKEVVEYKREQVQDMHDRAVKYEDKTERVFSWLQVVTAAMASFAHGANDVSNAIGPVSAVFAIWQSGTVPGPQSHVPTWILVFGGVGIQLGLLLYGYRMMRNLGNNLTHMSPTRGFTMELGAIATVLLATFFGLPVSTTHCIVGATVAVGLCNGDVKAVNWKQIAVVLSGWMVTIPIAGLTAGLATAFGASAPNFVPGYPA